MNIFKGDSADAIWRDIIKALTDKQGSLPQSSRFGPTKEILHAHYCLTNPRQRWVWSRIPAINPAFAIAEYFWILSGSNDSSFINQWFPTLPKFMGSGPTYHGAYGHRIRKLFGFDQLERAYNVFQENPDSRQVVLQIWTPELDFPSNNGSPSSSDVPCNICSLLKIRQGRLEWTQILRSNDVYRGMPYNVVQFTMLQETLAGWLGLGVGEYHQVSDSLHLYDSDYTELSVDIDEVILGEPDNIALTKDEHDKVFEESINALRYIASNDVTSKSIHKTVSSLDLPQPYINLLSITAAEIARREKWLDAMELLAAQCTNEMLSIMWHRWISRFLNKQNT